MQETQQTKEQLLEELHELRTRNASLKAMLDAVPDMIFRVDSNGTYLEFVPGRGVEPVFSPSEFIGKAMADLMPADLTEKTLKDVSDTCRTGTVHTHQYDLSDAGKSRRFEYRMLPSGQDEVLVFVRDITEKAKAERALAETEQRLLALTQAAFDGVAVSVEGDIVEANEAFAKILGLEPAEAIGARPLESLSPESIETARRHFEARDESPYEIVAIHKDGSERQIEVVGKNVVYKGQPARVAGFRDVTEHKRAAEELKASEERYRSLFETMAQGVVYQDPDGRIVSANPAAERILGLTLDQMQGRTSIDPRWKSIREDGSDFPGEDHPSMVALRTGERVSDVVMGVFHPQAEKHRWIIINAVPQFRPGETAPFQVYTTFEDITALKEAEEERLKLETRVLDAQRVESLSVLAGGVAHDFNNLLMGVLGNAELALRELSPASPARENIERIRVSGLQAADLSNQMLAYSGKAQFHVTELSLSDVLSEMDYLVSSAIPNAATIDYDIADQVPQVSADASQLRQVVLGLVTNASEALVGEGGMIRVSVGSMDCSREYLTDTVLGEEREEGQYAYLEVSDSGCGMDGTTISKMFDPFFTTKFTGRGLGLAAVLGVVRGHNGAIRIDSHVGKGTRIRVLLPAIAPAKSAADRKVSGPHKLLAGRTILFVDDEPEIIAVAEAALARAKVMVLAATDGDTAVQLFAERMVDIDCIILDLTMPGKDSDQVFDDFRQVSNDVPVILSSGYGEEEVLSRFADGEFAAFLRKPYSLDALLSVVESVL